MKVLLDTSVLVSACVQVHPAHERCRPWLSRAAAKELDAFVSSHSLAELYAALTAMPLRPRISPNIARRLLRDNVEALTQVVELEAADYRVVLDRAAELGLSGRVLFDALIARAAEKAAVDKLLTLNPRDFRRVWPESLERISTP